MVENILTMYERLTPYYEAACEESDRLLETQPLKQLETIIADQQSQNVSFRDAIASSSDVAVIAEHKRASPSEGDIKPDSSVGWQAEQYQQGGAAALSILTQEKYFKGTLEDLFQARQASTLPILRKDFISSETQLYQAKAYGADAVLLIVGGLSVRQLSTLQEEAHDLALDCLVEVHNKVELDDAMESMPDLIGINNRNLATLKVDLTTTERLIKELPADIPVVAESGYRVDMPEHLKILRDIKADGVLIGTDLMKKEYPAEALSKWFEGYSISLK